MPQPPIKLHAQSLRPVVDVAVGHAAGDGNPSLSDPNWEAMGSLHVDEVAMFEDRVGPRPDVGQDRDQQRPVSESGAYGEGGQQTFRRGPTVLDEVSQHADAGVQPSL